jgi:putative phage-type endonuclease
MLTAQQLELRRSGIGGSEAAAVLGLSPYETPFSVYQKKKSGEFTEQNEQMLWGSLLEQTIREQYCTRNNVKVTVPAMTKSKIFPWMLANVDGITSEGKGLEIKTSAFGHGFGESGSDEIPEQYLIQIQHYMIVEALPVFDVAVLIGGSDYRQYEIEADRELQDMIIEGERKWWGNFINDIPPDPITFDEIKQRYAGISKANKVEATQACQNAILLLKELKENMKVWEEKEKEYKAIIMKEFGDNDTLACANKILATWKSDKSGRPSFDMKEFEKSYPELYQKFVKFGAPARRLLIK